MNHHQGSFAIKEFIPYAKYDPRKIWNSLSLRFALGIDGLLGKPRCYMHLACPDITQQTVSFRWQRKIFSVSCDSDSPVIDEIREIIELDIYNLKKIQSKDPSQLVVIDAGANIGLFSLVISAMGVKTIAAIEPFHKNQDYIQKNLENNQLPVPHIFRGALVSAHSKIYLKLAPDSVGHAVTHQQIPGVKILEIQGYTLQDVYHMLEKQHIDLLKMDIEGSEYDVLLNSPDEWFSPIQNIAMEFHEKTDYPRHSILINRLNALGYTVTTLPDPHHRRGLGMIYASR